MQKGYISIVSLVASTFKVCAMPRLYLTCDGLAPLRSYPAMLYTRTLVSYILLFTFTFYFSTSLLGITEWLSHSPQNLEHKCSKIYDFWILTNFLHFPAALYLKTYGEYEYGSNTSRTTIIAFIHVVTIVKYYPKACSPRPHITSIPNFFRKYNKIWLN